MKKIMATVAVLVLISLLCIPFVNGIIMERTLMGAVGNMNNMYTHTGSDMRFEIESYNRGVFDTQVDWRIHLGGLGRVYGLEDVVLTETAKHGFRQITSKTSLKKNSWYGAWVKHGRGGKDPLAIRTTYPLTGPIVLTVALDPVYVDTKKTTLDIGALKLKHTIDKSFASVTVTGTWQGISEGANKTGPMVIHAAHNRITDFIWEGKGTVTAASIWVDENGTCVNLPNLNLDYALTSDPNHEKMNMSMGMTTGEIIFNGRPLHPWAVALGVENVDIPALQDVAALYSELINRHMSKNAGAGLTLEAVGQEFQKLMSQNASTLVAGLAKLMKKDLEFKISRLDLALPHGDISGHLALGLKQDLTMAKCLMLAARPDLALNIFSLESDLCLPSSLVPPKPPYLTVPVFAGMKTGFFVQDGNTLRHRAGIRGRRLYLNEQEVSLKF